MAGKPKKQKAREGRSKPGKYEKNTARESTIEQPVKAQNGDKTVETKSDSGRSADRARVPCQVVGVGASAGGLEAIQGLLANLPDDAGIALVVIQHRAHDRQSVMSSLLQKYTKMQIEDISDGAHVRPNRIYLAPPNTDVSIMNGVLYCAETTPHKGPPLPIDYFFRSLADDQAVRAIGIVLSGTGSDGTLGLKEIKAAGGMVMAQDPKQAAYDQMPRNAIDTGMVDYIRPVEEMAKELVGYVKHPYIQAAESPDAEKKLETQLQKVFLIIRTETGHDFSHYKRNTIKRRIGRRLAIHQIENLNEYIGFLRSNPEEVRILSRELRITVTAFFRDAEAFEALTEKALKPMVEKRPANMPIRVWVPGCATGEEAYSVAILIYEQMREIEKLYEIQVFGTDLDEDAIERARWGRYPKNIAGDISKERLAQFFAEEDNNYRIKTHIREMLVFAQHNLIKEPPFSRLDLICCRNVLIYMDPTLQEKLLPLFHYALSPGGILFLGESESIGRFADLFEALDVRRKIFRRKPGRADYEPGAADFQLHHQRASKAEDDRQVEHRRHRDIGGLAERLILRDYSAPCVLINQDYHALYFNGDTSPYLAQPSGQPTLNLVQLARPSIQHKLGALLKSAGHKHHTIREDNVPIGMDDDHSGTDIIVRPIREFEGEGGLILVVFRRRERETTGEGQDTKTAGVPAEEKDARITALEQELRSTREYLQTTIEELETSNEELKSTNEELQSTNEELDTSREELQSTNEELRSVNAEHQAKIEEISKANDDMNNLLGCTGVATLFLDNEMRIRRFTPEARKLFRLIDSDIDRPLRDITAVIEYDAFAKNVRHVLDTLERVEKELAVGDDAWYIMRIVPYRTGENVIDGVVATFVDITEQARDFAEAIVETIREPLMVLDSDLKVVLANDAFYRAFQTRPNETEGCLIYELGNKQWDIPQLRELLEKIIPENARFDGFLVEHEFPRVGYRRMLLDARQTIRGRRRMGSIPLAFNDISEKPEDRANSANQSRRDKNGGSQ